jgi:1,6-anhydro-N-acetylmuramate kinase
MTDHKKLVQKARTNAMSHASHGAVEQTLTWRAADAIETLLAERNALRAQINAIKAAWNAGTGWVQFGNEVERILREGDQP